MRGYDRQRLTHLLLKRNGELQMIQVPLIDMEGNMPWNVTVYYKLKYTFEYLYKTDDTLYGFMLQVHEFSLQFTGWFF